MEIHIGNLPANTTVADLNQLFGFPANPPQCRVFSKQSRTGQVIWYGLAIVRPESAAQRLLERYRGATLHGSQLEMRPFVARRISNERRAVDWRNKPWFGAERRKSERRGH